MKTTRSQKMAKKKTAPRAHAAASVTLVTINETLVGMGKHLEAIDNRFDVIDNRFEAIDKRFEAIDKRFETIDNRFNSMDKRFDDLNHEMDAFRAEMHQRADDAEKHLLALVENHRIDVADASKEKLDQHEHRIRTLEVHAGFRAE